MTDEKPKTRLFVTDPLEGGVTIGLDHARAHYLRSVLRLSPGQSIALFNGCDGEWTAIIDGLGKGWCSLTVTECRRTQTTVPDLWLAFAPIKKARLDFLIQKAVELGVTRLIPVYTRFTDVSRVNIERLQANAIEAAEQCERLDAPKVVDPVTLDRLLASWPAERWMLVCAERRGARPVADIVSELPAAAPAALFSGPEGGFEKTELDGLEKLPFVRLVGLGPRILRAETAAIAAIVCWQAIAGDWSATA